MKLVLRMALAATLFLVCGCVADYESPYHDYDTPELSWPTLDPNRYHWDGIANPFFEVWTYKVTDPQTRRSFLFVYGVQNPGALPGEPSGAYLYALRDDGDFIYTPFPFSRFDASVAMCDATIGTGHATESKITGELSDDNGQVRWNLSLDTLAEWTETMGILKNIPALPFNWYVNGLDVRATGTIHWRDRTYELSDVASYNDHTWGTVYPEAWIWIQANGFEDETEALSGAGGPVTLGSFEPPNYMIVFKTGGRLYEFRTQDLNLTMSIDASIKSARAKLTATQGDLRISIIADAHPDDLIDALVPRYAGVIPGAGLALNGAFIVDLMEKRNGQWTLIKRSTTSVGVLEFGGTYAGFEPN